MENAKALKFFQEALAKTAQGRIRWEPTAIESVLIASIGGEFTLTLNRYHLAPTGVKHELLLKDYAGREVLCVDSSIDGVTEKDLDSLCEAVRRSARWVPEKVDRVLEHLSKL